MIVPALRFYLDMFTDNVETGAFSQFNIIKQSFFGWSRKSTIGPITLVKQTDLEDKLTIDHRTHDTIYHFHRHGTHAKIGIHFVYHFTLGVF